MTAAKEIMNVSQSMTALAIANNSMKLANKKKATTKDFVNTGFNSIIGTNLLKANVSFIGEL
jgi:hypothetical protein